MVGYIHHDKQNDVNYIDVYGERDTIEKVNYRFSMARNYWIDDGKTMIHPRNIILYLRKDYTDAIDEVNWDSTTNAFQYIIQQQFYEITPNPNAATTLYTDYNITSSKIITADNITTMRSDLNVVSNTVDVMNYDVKELESKVDSLAGSMVEQQLKTKYIKTKTDEIDKKANIGIALGVAGCVLGATGIGVAGKALSFASKTVGGAVKEGGECVNTVIQMGGDSLGPAVQTNIYDVLEDELPDIGFDIWFDDLKPIPIGRARALAAKTNKLEAICEWCEKEYQPITSINFNEEDGDDDPSKVLMTMPATIDICNRFRHTLKPVINVIANKVNELDDKVNNIDVSNELSTLENKINTKFNEYVSKYELSRDDEIDIFARFDNEHKVILFEFEDNIVNGIIVFKIFAVNGSNNRQRRFYIKITDGTIVDYKGVQENITIDGLTIKGLANSENDRVSYMPNAELVLDTSERFISITVNENYLITGVVVEQCTCMRQMIFTTNDIAYLQDIESLNKKINALAEQSHSNDVQTFALNESMRDEFATVDEVNEVLTNYVQKNELPPIVDTSEFAKATREMEYTTIKEVLNETDDMPMGNYKFTLKKPSSI